MTTASNPIVDRKGRAMFHCTRCGAPVTSDDFFDLGIRLPDADEDLDDYREAELIDSVDHVDCNRARQAG